MLELDKEFMRLRLTQFLQWNDRNGCYTDENCMVEECPKLTYEDTIKYFIIVLNEDDYYSIIDNMFELTYDEVIEVAKNKGIYNKSIERLQLLLSKKDFSEELCKKVIE